MRNLLNGQFITRSHVDRDIPAGLPGRDWRDSRQRSADMPPSLRSVGYQARWGAPEHNCCRRTSTVRAHIPGAGSKGPGAPRPLPSVLAVFLWAAHRCGPAAPQAQLARSAAEAAIRAVSRQPVTVLSNASCAAVRPGRRCPEAPSSPARGSLPARSSRTSARPATSARCSGGTGPCPQWTQPPCPLL